MIRPETIVERRRDVLTDPGNKENRPPLENGTI